MAAGQRAGNLTIQAGDLACQIVDQNDVVLQLLLGGIVQLLQRGRSRAKARSQLIHAGEHGVAGRAVCGGRLHIGKGIHHVVDGCTQAAIAAGVNVLHLHQRLVADGVGRAGSACGIGLAAQQIAVVAHDSGHLHTLADKAGACVLTLDGLGGYGLAGIARGADVGNIVASDGQCLLVGDQCGDADIH